MSKSPFGNIKVALDTNILAYLLDKTYPNLNKFILELKDSGLVDLICSQFVIYELIEIRKLEHYIRKIHRKATENKGVMNFSSILKYRKDWSAPELDYKDACDDIINLVEDDIKKIYEDFGIYFSDVSIHKDLWKPHQDLVLNSKISKEDSLVLLSSVYPDIGVIEDYVIFLTNDDKFFKASAGQGKAKIEKLDDVFTNNNIPQPTILKINNVTLPTSNTKFDIINDGKTNDEIKEFTHNFIFEHFQIKNSKFLLGNIIPCQCSKNNKAHMFCFYLQKESLNKGIFLSVLTKNLLVFNMPKINSNFWAHKEITNYPYKPDEEMKNRELAIKLLDDNGNALITEDELKEIMVNGNLVFIHPDNEI